MSGRGLWRPWMRREYGIHPWELPRYTARELRALGEDFEERAREAVSDGTF